MFTPKLIITDLDGTALRNDKTVSPATIAAFSRCQSAGIPIAIATARYLAGARAYVKALHPDYQILTDGTLVYHQQKLIYSNAMDTDTTNCLLTELKRCGYASHIAIPTVYGLFRYPEGCCHFPSLPSDLVPSIHLDFHSEAFQTTEDGNTVGYHFDIDQPFPFPGNKLVVELPSDEEAERIASLCNCKQFHYRGETLYTFFHPTASKLDAIRHVADQLKISLKDILVFGDDINDMEMIQNCGMGIAMGNALPEVKAAANLVIDTNEKDGLAQYLNQTV